MARARLRVRIEGPGASSAPARRAARRLVAIGLGAATRRRPVLPGVSKRPLDRAGAAPRAGPANRRRRVALGGGGHGDPGAAGQPRLRLRHPPRARAGLRAQGADSGRDLRGLSRAGAPGPGAAGGAAPLPALASEGGGHRAAGARPRVGRAFRSGDRRPARRGGRRDIDGDQGGGPLDGGDRSAARARPGRRLPGRRPRRREVRRDGAARPPRARHGKADAPVRRPVEALPRAGARVRVRGDRAAAEGGEGERRSSSLPPGIPPHPSPLPPSGGEGIGRGMGVDQFVVAAAASKRSLPSCREPLRSVTASASARLSTG